MQIAKRSPCEKCNHKNIDKDQIPCNTCFKPIYYDISLMDVRLITEYYIKDIESLNKPKPIHHDDTTKIHIDKTLKENAKKNGYKNYIKWIVYLYYKKGLSIKKVADKTGVGITALKTRLKDNGYKLRTVKEAWTLKRKMKKK